MPSDEELAVRLAHGDEAALAELLKRYERRISSFLYRHTGGRDVEDLYQETWLRVARHAGRFDARQRFSTWIFQIALNLARDWHRRRPPEPEDREATGSDAGGLERTEARADAARLLAELPDPQREAVILRFYHDLSEEQMAEVLACPRGTVKSRLHQGLRRLSDLVRKEPSA